MDISQVARKTGVAASTLRYYEKQGLIHSLGRQGARRVFAPSVLQQLALISLGQAAGLSLEEIRQMFTPGGAVQIDRDLLRRKAGEIDGLIRQLRAMSHGLRHAADCPAQTHTECPSFQKLLTQAASGALPKRSAPLEPGRASGQRRAARS